MTLPAIIILDGPDAAGKTTLAENIKKHVGAENYSYEHLTYIKENYAMWQANMRAIDTARNAAVNGRVHVIDRGWISENIYSASYRGGSAMPFTVRGFDRLLQRYGATYVMCCPKPEFAMANHARMLEVREEMYQPDARLEEVARRFHLLAHHHDLNGSRFFEEPKDYVELCTGRFSPRRREDVLNYDIDSSFQHSIHNIVSFAANHYQSRTAVFDVIDAEKRMAGNLRAPIVMVDYRPRRNSAVFKYTGVCVDTFVSRAGLTEDQLLWIYADDTDSAVSRAKTTGFFTKRVVVALHPFVSMQLSLRRVHHYVVDYRSDPDSHILLKQFA